MNTRKSSGKRWLAVAMLAVVAAILFRHPIAEAARTVSGLPGVYNGTLMNLEDGNGSALSTDSNGRVIISPSSTIGVATNSSFTVSSVTTTNFSANKGASATTTILFGETALTGGRACIQMPNTAGVTSSLYVNTAGTLVIELIACR